jgi:hypothetical protein
MHISIREVLVVTAIFGVLCTSSNLHVLVHIACRAFSDCSAALERSDNYLISLIVRCR